MNIKPLQIGEKTAALPLIQGGMGVGVSLSGLAVGAIVGILLNAILPGKDYEFGKVDTETAENPMNMQV